MDRSWNSTSGWSLTIWNLMFAELSQWHQIFWRRQIQKVSEVTVYQVKRIAGKITGNTKVMRMWETMTRWGSWRPFQGSCAGHGYQWPGGSRRQRDYGSWAASEAPGMAHLSIFYSLHTSDTQIPFSPCPAESLWTHVHSRQHHNDLLFWPM